MEHAWPTQYVCIGEETYCKADVRQSCISSVLIPVRPASAPLSVSTHVRTHSTTHGVVNGEPGGDAPAGRVDVQVDGLGRVLRLEEQQLRDRQRRVIVVYLAVRAGQCARYGRRAGRQHARARRA
jgi:hypothetical protein